MSHPVSLSCNDFLFSFFKSKSITFNPNSFSFLLSSSTNPLSFSGSAAVVIKHTEQFLGSFPNNFKNSFLMSLTIPAEVKNSFCFISSILYHFAIII